MNGTDLRKWGARTITALSGVAIMYLTTGSWDQEESIALVTAVSAALVSLLVPPSEGTRTYRSR